MLIMAQMANYVTASASTIVKPSRYINFSLSLQNFDFLEAAAWYASLHKPDTFEDILSKRKFEKFCQLVGVKQDFPRPELTLYLKNNNLLAKICSFKNPEVKYIVKIPIVKKGDDVLPFLQDYYYCTCKRGIYSTPKTNLDLDMHSIYLGNFGVNKIGIHDFGILGPTKRMRQIIGKRMKYISEKYEKLLPKNEMVGRFPKMTEEISEVIRSDFISGSKDF